MLVEIAPETKAVARPAARTRSKQEVPVLGRATQDGRRNWVTTLFMLAFHIGAVAAPFFFTWKALISALVLWVLAINGVLLLLAVAVDRIVALRLAAALKKRNARHA